MANDAILWVNLAFFIYFPFWSSCLFLSSFSINSLTFPYLSYCQSFLLNITVTMFTVLFLYEVILEITSLSTDLTIWIPHPQIYLQILVPFHSPNWLFNQEISEMFTSLFYTTHRSSHFWNVIWEDTNEIQTKNLPFFTCPYTNLFAGILPSLTHNLRLP